MKSNAALIWMLLLAIASAPGSALSQSTTAMVAGRVMGLPNENVANFQVVFVRDTVPCAVLQSHPLTDGSFRLSSVRAGDYRVAVRGIPEGYGITRMTAGGLDLLFNSVRLVASTQTQVLIEVARVEDLRREKSTVVHVGVDPRSQCLIHKVKPVYPSQAKAAHIVGNVILSVRVDKNGYVKDVMVVEGHPLLIQAAIDVVRQWRYAPFVCRGEMVPVVTTVIVSFGPK
jgi:TonB family protein